MCVEEREKDWCDVCPDSFCRDILEQTAGRRRLHCQLLTPPTPRETDGGTHQRQTLKYTEQRKKIALFIRHSTQGKKLYCRLLAFQPFIKFKIIKPRLEAAPKKKISKLNLFFSENKRSTVGGLPSICVNGHTRTYGRIFFWPTQKRQWSKAPLVFQ